MKRTLTILLFIFLFGCSNNPVETKDAKLQKIDTLNFINYNFPDTLNNDSSGFLYYFDRATVCIERKQHHEAIQFLHRGKHLAVSQASAYLYLASTWALIHTKAAVDSVFFHMNRAIEKDPDNSIYYFARSRFYNDVGNNVEALRDIEMAIKYSPKNNKMAYINQRGAYKMALGDFEGAVQDIKNVAKDNENNVEFLLAQSMIYNQLDMHSQALAAATKLIKLDSNIAQAYVIRGSALHHLKRRNESMQDFYKARALGDTTANHYINRHESTN